MLNNNHQARWWKKLEKGNVQCYLCPRLCIIPEGKKGFCFVRQNIRGELILTTYGRSSGFCIDPIEKKPLNNFYPGTTALSFGTIGCNLGCLFCQNSSISKPSKDIFLDESISPCSIAQSAKKSNCKSVAFTYNEPIVSAEYVADTAKECHKIGIKTVAVTAGYILKEAREEFFKNIDATNVDLKSFSNNFYKKFCSASLKPVLDTLIFIKKQTDTWLEITNLVIPNKNDSADEIEKMCSWIVSELGKDVPLHFSAFHPSFKMMNHPPTPKKTLENAREIALSKGLRYVYLGNVYDEKGENTYCHNCGDVVISRKNYQIINYKLDAGSKCKECGTLCAGCFD